MMRSSRGVYVALWTTAVALYVGLVHVTFLSSIPDPIIQPDSISYLMPALRLLFHEPFGLSPSRTIGYPLFLFGILRCAPSLHFVMVVQHVLWVVTGTLAGLLYYRRFDRSPACAVLVAGLVAISPMGTVSAHAILTECLYTFMLVIATSTLLESTTDHRIAWAMVAGIALALTVWVRPTGLSLFVWVALLGLRRWGRSLGLAAFILLATCAYRLHADGFFGLDRFAGISLFGTTARFLDVRTLRDPALIAALKPSYDAHVERLANSNWVRYGVDGPVAALRGTRDPIALNALLVRLSAKAVLSHPLGIALAQARAFIDFLSHRSAVPALVLDRDYTFFVYRGILLYVKSAAIYGPQAYALLSPPSAAFNKSIQRLMEMDGTSGVAQEQAIARWRAGDVYAYPRVLALWKPLRPLFGAMAGLPWLAVFVSVILLRDRATRFATVFLIGLIATHILATTLGGDGDLRHAIPLEPMYWILAIAGIRRMIALV